MKLKYMQMALNLAIKGGDKVFPNPKVGCIIVKDNKIVGSGCHEYFGGPHAEINALKEAGKSAAGADLYVTLEPCAHWGKTPPCCESIIKAKIKRVIACMKDPNPVTAGKGFARLRQNGIVVLTDIMKQEACKLNRQYIKSFENMYPAKQIIVKSAISLDGKIAAYTGDSKWITSEKARKYVHKIRSNVDAIIVGVNTVIKDDPELTSHGQGKNPVRVIIDPQLRVPVKSRVFDKQSPAIIIYSKSKLKSKLDILKDKHVYLLKITASKKGLIDFKKIFNMLFKMSIYKILVEGGGETIAAALSSGMVDELALFMAPKIIGGRTAKTFVEGKGVKFVSNAINIENLKIKKIDNDYLLTGKINVHRNN